MYKTETIQELVLPILESMGVELVEIQCHGTGNRTILRIFVDEPGGITLDRCAQVSREISDLLDRKDPIACSYVLQVSSPGLDRPLKTEHDFIRNIGKNIELVVRQDHGTLTIVGQIVQAGQEGIVLQHHEQSVTIGYHQVVKAKPVIELKKEGI